MITGKGGIRASIREGKIRVSTEKVGSGRVPKIGDPGKYRKVESERVSEKVKSG